MRKNPREDFKWLEDELLALAEEEKEEELPENADLKWWEADEEIRNPGWSVGIYADDEEFDENAAVVPLTPKQRRQQQLQQRKQRKAEIKKKKKKQKGIGGLIFLALLELAGILAIAWWWIQWLT